MTKFIYFDVGGVVVRDFSGTNCWNEMKREWGVRPENEDKFEELWEINENERCIGGDIESLKPLINIEFGTNLPKEYSILWDGFVNRFDVNKSIWPVISEAKTKYQIGLLTNMYTGMYDALSKKGLFPDVKWDVIIDSSLEKVQKPDVKIFQLAEERSGYKGKEILFVENSKGHVEAAEEFGWNTFLYDSANSEISSQKLMEMIRIPEE